MTAETIGERWEETLERVDRLLLVQSELIYDERNFLNGLRRRLIQYEAETFLTAKQLNWITAMEGRYLERQR